MSPSMHPGQLTPDARTVARLVARRFPDLAGLPVRAVDSAGTVNALFRVGDDLVARMPLQPTVTRSDLDAEVRTAERLLAAGLPVATPAPVAVGDPDDGWPVPWSLWRWIPGATAYDLDVSDDAGFARDLGTTVRALRAVPTRGETFPGGRRGGDLREHDDDVAVRLEDARGMVDTAAVARLWHDLRELPHAPDADTFTHGDLMPGNLLVAPGRLVAVLDAEIAGVADPAVDLAPAWNLLTPAARAVFRTEADVDDLTWDRGRAWSLAQALGTVAYYRATNARMSTTGARTLAALVADA